MSHKLPTQAKGEQKCHVVIPARLHSTRLPEKLLLKAGGKSILQHTFEAASRSKLAHRVTVAVDDSRLAKEVESFGGRFVMTSPDCPSGTDRVAEVARSHPEDDLFINVQGDEPEIDPHSIDRVGELLLENPKADMGTLGTPIRCLTRLHDPGCVKIVQNSAGRAIYFSRSAVPHDREGFHQQRLEADPPQFWHHLGLYSYRREFLAWFTSQPPSPLEQMERLEQLRAIEAGKTIFVAQVDEPTVGIDTHEDYQRFLERQSSLS